MGLTDSTEFVIEINNDHCSLCSICSSTCPFEALSADREKKEIKLDIEKCQVCGVCYSACPAGAIESVYYDLDALFRYITSQRQEVDSKELVLTCRGSLTEPGHISEITETASFIPLYLPCVGRVPVEFYLKALSLGIERIIVIPCQQDLCHFKDGSSIGARRLNLLHPLLDQLGYDAKTIKIETYKTVAHVDDDKCVSCLTCVRVCQKYKAPYINQAGVAEIDAAKCTGCGVCLGECPAGAIQYSLVKEAVADE